MNTATEPEFDRFATVYKDVLKASLPLTQAKDPTSLNTRYGGVAKIAGGVVTHDVPAFAVAHGNPARVRHFRRGFAPDRPSILTLLSRLLRRSQ